MTNTWPPSTRAGTKNSSADELGLACRLEHKRRQDDIHIGLALKLSIYQVVLALAHGWRGSHEPILQAAFSHISGVGYKRRFFCEKGQRK